jgi:hypothetical protein
VVQAREFVALQGIAGRRQQKLPGGLSFVVQRTSERNRRSQRQHY